MPLWTQADLEDEISREVCLQYLDDDNDGEIDAASLARLQRASDSDVLSVIGPIKPIAELVALGGDKLKQLSLDSARYRLERRHPEYARRDWKDLRDAWREDVMDLRNGIAQLPNQDPNQAANVQVYLDQVGADVGDDLVCPTFNTTLFQF